MHSEILEKTNSVYSLDKVKMSFFIFYILGSICLSIAIRIITFIFGIVPLIGNPLASLATLALSFLFPVFMEVTIYDSLKNDEMPNLVTAFMERFLGTNKDFKYLIRWFLTFLAVAALPFIANILIGIIVIASYYLSPIISAFVILFNIIVTIAFIVSLNYVFFYLGDHRFDSLSPIDIVKKAFSTMKGHKLFYIKVIVQKYLPFVIISIAVIVVTLLFAILSIYVSPIYLMLASTLLIIYGIGAALYCAFYLTPFVKIFSFQLYEKLNF